MKFKCVDCRNQHEIIEKFEDLQTQNSLSHLDLSDKISICLGKKNIRTDFYNVIFDSQMFYNRDEFMWIWYSHQYVYIAFYFYLDPCVMHTIAC